ncbi:hypothetical protein COU80_02135 [Candidatus Peregrinibacteria bacterium CG10_big_fil_rev_8_21_14_0_10_55_24]|nr:MAG: hypothetical protein COU80_02135 [Candidatus Peregrinibacteria bacterium CG10_big_fil_rev_8_21_14_0_10_55_24]
MRFLTPHREQLLHTDFAFDDVIQWQRGIEQANLRWAEHGYFGAVEALLEARQSDVATQIKEVFSFKEGVLRILQRTYGSVCSLAKFGDYFTLQRAVTEICARNRNLRPERALGFGTELSTVLIEEQARAFIARLSPEAFYVLEGQFERDVLDDGDTHALLREYEAREEDCLQELDGAEAPTAAEFDDMRPYIMSNDRTMLWYFATRKLYDILVERGLPAYPGNS